MDVWASIPRARAGGSLKAHLLCQPRTTVTTRAGLSSVRVTRRGFAAHLAHARGSDCLMMLWMSESKCTAGAGAGAAAFAAAFSDAAQTSRSSDTLMCCSRDESGVRCGQVGRAFYHKHAHAPAQGP